MKILTIIPLAVILVSCGGNERQPDRQPNVAETREMLQRINKVLVQQDRAQILNYIKRNNLVEMKESPTGLFYYISGTSNGPKVRKGDVVEYSYRVSLLDGTVCYQSNAEAPATFEVGHGGVVSGLEEGILLMRQGQSAKFIMPPHLAYGLIGDSKQVPARSIVIYDVELLAVYR